MNRLLLAIAIVVTLFCLAAPAQAGGCGQTFFVPNTFYGSSFGAPVFVGVPFNSFGQRTVVQFNHRQPAVVKEFRGPLGGRFRVQRFRVQRFRVQRFR